MKKRRIVIYTDDFKPKLGGIAEYSYHLAKELHKQQLLEEVVTPVKQKVRYEFPVTFSRINRNRKLNARMGDGIFLFRKFNSFIHKCIVSLYIFTDLQKYVFDKGKYLILFTAYYNFFLHKLMLDVCRKLGIPYSIILHGLDILDHSNNENQQFISVVKGAEFLVFNSNATKASFNSLYPGLLNNHYVLHPGLDFDSIRRYNKYPLAHFDLLTGVKLESRLIISFVAHLRKRKGADLAISAISKLVKEHPLLYFLIAGEGPEAVELQQLIEKIGLQKHVFLLGRLNDDEKFSLLECSEIFLMPTKSLNGRDFEGFGISFIEASYFRNVVIGGRSGGEREAIAEGISGFTFDNDLENAEDALQEKISQLLDDRILRKRIQQEGKDFVETNFHWNKLIGGFVAYLENTDFNRVEI